MSPELHIVEFLAKGPHQYFSSSLKTVDWKSKECDLSSQERSSSDFLLTCHDTGLFQTFFENHL